MKNISHSRIVDNSTSYVVDEINKRAKRQSRWYAIIFALLGILVLLYILYSISVSRYDGFLVSRNAVIRHVDNIAVVDYRVKPGDEVQQGDTLYSYINVDYVARISDPYSIFEQDSRKWDAEYRRDKLKSEYIEQRRTLDSLQKIILRTKDDVSLGVATKEFLEQLQWDKVQVHEKMEHTQRLIAQEQSMINSLGSGYDIDHRIKGIGTYSHDYRTDNATFFGDAFNHRVAYVDMVIVDINARHGVLITSAEPVLTYMPYNTPDMLDLHVKMLLTPNEFSEVDEGMIYDAYIGREIIGEVRATHSSTYIKNSNAKRQEGEEYEYSHNNKEIILRAEFLDKSTLLRKYQVDGFPVTLKRYKWKPQTDEEKRYCPESNNQQHNM